VIVNSKGEELVYPLGGVRYCPLLVYWIAEEDGMMTLGPEVGASVGAEVGGQVLL
jgi:hypothetical protein